MEKHLWRVIADSHYGEYIVVTFKKEISDVEEVCRDHEIYDILKITYEGKVLT